jgi:hypothetical protein
MPIVYPLTPPATPTTRTLKMIAMSITAMTSSPFTGQQQVIEYPGEWWEMQCALPTMPRAQAEAWISFLLSLRGRSGTFLMGDRTAAAPRGIATGTPVVDGAGQTGKILNVKGWTPSQVGILKAGDYFQVGVGAAARLYKNLTDVNSDGAGKTALDVFPQVRDLPADLTAITTANPVGQFRLKANQREWDVDTALLYGIAFSAQEAI